MFKYSLREHTRAHKLGDSVSDEEKGRRLTALIAMQEEISAARNRQLIGSRYEVLVEGPARRGGGMLAGKTPQYKTAIFAGAEGIIAGDTVEVRVDSATGHSLMCSLV
jgi:tRNA-2-methylthio-N6-dimethylallyladenosine synthase